MIPLPFLKKKKEVKKVYIPVDLVLSYASKGLSETEIVSRLRSQGFEQKHIDRALRIALKERISPERFTHEIPETTVPATAPAPDYVMATPLGLEPPQPTFEERAPPEQPYITRRPVQSPEQARETTFTFEREPEFFQTAPEEITIEELIEGVVDERWKEFEDRLIDFERRDIQLENEIEDLRKSLREIKSSVTERETDLITKLDEFGGSVDNIEGRIGSIEKVFKDFLPELTQNIKSMSDLVEKIREERK